jgi:hypothetical protein
MLNNYENSALLRCLETGDFEPVTVFEFTPRVTLGVEILPGTPFYKKLTLQYVQGSDDYRTEAFGRMFISRGPRIMKKNEPPKFKSDVRRSKKIR